MTVIRRNNLQDPLLDYVEGSIKTDAAKRPTRVYLRTLLFSTCMEKATQLETIEVDRRQNITFVTINNALS
jgi:hypothetical protein